MSSCVHSEKPRSGSATAGNKGFAHGVASGDPTEQAVILWTRYEPIESESAKVDFEVSTDKGFETIVAAGSAKAEAASNYCVKVDVQGLTAGMSYYYRFKSGDDYSPVGKTKTLPENVDRLKIGVVNCAKYSGGYYHAYEELAKMEDIDVVIHVGDYIYENGASKPGSSYWPSTQATGRQHDPPRECISLEDYRTRYSQYKLDSSLQKLHARFPMIVIWDDHEIAMIKHMTDPDTGEKIPNPNWEERRDNSIIAYHEWLPLRPKAFETIYRSFQFGDLVNLMMLDARVCCKSEVTKTQASLEDTSRHIIGNAQLQWIMDGVNTADADWNVFGNQLLISLKGNGWERWQGFPYDRDRFLSFVEANPKRNFVFTTGNAHNPHHYIVLNEDKTDTLLHEFLPGSVSSGNNAEKAFYDPTILAKEEKRLTEAENVLWFHQDSHGFIVLDVTKEELRAKWYFVSTIREKEYALLEPYAYRLPSNGL